MNYRKLSFSFMSFFAIVLFIMGFISMMMVNATTPDDDGFFGNLVKNLGIENEPFNILLLGGDVAGSNTDTILLVHFDPKDAKTNILSIPRDTRINIPGSVNKINAAFSAGGSGDKGGVYACKKITELLGVNIKYYVFLNTSVFRTVIDQLGGVDIDIPINMDYEDPGQNLFIHLKKGPQHLNGLQAEGFMRFRHPNGSISKNMMQFYDGSDLKRIDAQQKFIMEVVKQKATLSNVSKVNQIIDVVFNKVTTNIRLENLLSITANLDNIHSDQVNTFKLSGKDATINGLSYFLYGNQILNTKTQETLSGKQILNDYFDAKK